jgi:hypothetical protein
MPELNSINPTELSILANMVAIILSKDRTSDELNVLGNFIVALGGTLLLIAAQQQSIQSAEDKLKQIKDLKNQIKELEKNS